MTQTYAQLAREIAALQASAQKQLAIEAKGAIAKINGLISTYGLMAGDLKFASTAASAASAVSPSASKKLKATNGKGRAAAKGAKFSDGNGKQWGGRGPRPAWLRDAIASGRTLESFAVGAAAPAAIAPVLASPAKKVSSESIAFKRMKSGAGSAKTRSGKMSAAAKSAPVAGVAAPADAAMSPVKASRKKVAVNAPAESSVGAEATPAVKPPVKKSPGRKATKAARVSTAAKKATSAKKQVAGSESAVTAKKVAARKAAPSRKKANPTSAVRKATVVNSQAPSAPEAVAETAAA